MRKIIDGTGVRCVRGVRAERMDCFVSADGMTIAPVFEVDPKSWTVENEIGTGRKHSEEKLFRVLFCLGK